jgi:AraC-like DNA-binding protein
MSRSATLVFDDPIPYQAALRGGEVEVLPVTKGEFHAKLILMDCDRLWTTYASENLPRVAHSALSAKRVFFSFLADTNQLPAQYCGLEVSSKQMVIGVPGSTRHIRTHGPCRWASMSVTPNDLSAASSALIGRELHAGSVTRLVYSQPANMARLMRLHRTSRQLVEEAPEIFRHPEVAKAIEHELVHAMVSCLADDSDIEVSLGWRHHSQIVRRFEEVLAANNDRPLHLEEICTATEASARVLRNSCQEHLGMGPLRYLWLRRLHSARRALVCADPSRTTVTQIATCYGFWQLGRFAVSYQGLFGETPSATLQKRSNAHQV